MFDSNILMILLMMPRAARHGSQMRSKELFAPWRSLLLLVVTRMLPRSAKRANAQNREKSSNNVNVTDVFAGRVNVNNNVAGQQNRKM